MTAGPLVVVHGGAGRVHPSLHAAVIEGTARACDEAWQVLASSGDGGGGDGGGARHGG